MKFNKLPKKSDRLIVRRKASCYDNIHEFLLPLVYKLIEELEMNLYTQDQKKITSLIFQIKSIKRMYPIKVIK